MILRNRFVAAALIAAVVAAAFVAGVGYGQRGQAAGSARAEGFRLLEALSDRVSDSFITKNVDERKLFLGAAKGMLESLGDPYTRFMEPRAFEEFRQDARGFFFGVGIFIDIKDAHLIVVQPIKGTPAARAGLRAGDRITRIDGVATDGMAIQEAVVRIRGPRGTPVKLTIRRGTREFVTSIVRDRIEIAAGEGPDTLDAASRNALAQNRIGYVKLITFNEETARTFDRLFDDARRSGAKALILDLRSNGGGLLDVSLQVANRFVPSGRALVLTVNRNGQRSTERATAGPKITMPVVVLVNEYTASASEIVSGALEDNGIATLVGVKTFGKGVIQTIYDLPMNSGAAITTAKYLTPNGRDIHGRGLTPAVVVGETEDALRERLRAKTDAEVDQGLERMRADQLRRAIEVVKQKLSR